MSETAVAPDEMSPSGPPPVAARPPIAESNVDLHVGRSDDLERPSTPVLPVRRSRVTTISRVMTVAGGAIVLLLVYVFAVSSIPQRRSQSVLLEQFGQVLATSGARSSSTAGADSGVLTGDSTSGAPSNQPNFEVAPPPPERGSPVALLQIPAIGVQQVVVEGTSTAELHNGPGHYRASVMPGEAGNAAIVGSRTSNGAPFRSLDQLHRGDEIKVTTTGGTFTYKVDDVRTLQPTTDPDPVQALKVNRLTLLTSSPPYRGGERLAVFATLQGRPVAAQPGASPVAAGESDDAFAASADSMVLALLWTQLLVLAFLGTWWLYARWRAWTVWLLSTPVLLALMFVVFENLAGLLPPAL